MPISNTAPLAFRAFSMKQIAHCGVGCMGLFATSILVSASCSIPHKIPQNPGRVLSSMSVQRVSTPSRSHSARDPIRLLKSEQVLTGSDTVVFDLCFMSSTNRIPPLASGPLQRSPNLGRRGLPFGNEYYCGVTPEEHMVLEPAPGIAIKRPLARLHGERRCAVARRQLSTTCNEEAIGASTAAAGLDVVLSVFVGLICGRSLVCCGPRYVSE